MSQWKEVRGPNTAPVTDSEDGWTEANASPKSDIKSPFSEALSDSYVDVGVDHHSSTERSVSPFSLVSAEPERFIPDDRQDLTPEESSNYESAHDGDGIHDPFEDEDIPEDDDMPEDYDPDDIGDWDTRSIRTITAKKQMAEDSVAADELLAIKVAEQIKRDIMDAEVARWISEAPFPDDFDITFENLLAHGLISPEVLETLEASNQIPSSAISGTQVDPSGLNPAFRYVEEKTQPRQASERGLRSPPRLEPTTLAHTFATSTQASSSSSNTKKAPEIKVEIEKYPPKATEPEGPLVLLVCSICKGYYRPADNPFVSTLASPSSSKSPYFDQNQASPFPFGLELNCPTMHGSCIDCMEKHIMTRLRVGQSAGAENTFPIRCPACLKEEEDRDEELNDGPMKQFRWEVPDYMAEKILGPTSLELWRQRREEQTKLLLSLNEPQIIHNYDENHLLIEALVAVELEVVPPKITPASLQSGAIWQTGRELDSDKEPNYEQCRICMENTCIVTYPVIATQLAPRKALPGLPAYGMELECPSSHAFCAPCLTKYVNDCMVNAKRGTKGMVMCPACAGDMAAAVSGETEEWEDGKELTDDVVSRLLDDDMLAKWKMWKAKVAARSNRTFVCPNPDCAKDLEIPQTKTSYDRGQCPECHSKVCLECRIIWHEGFTCAENIALKTDEDKLFYTFAKKRLLRRCPKCQMVVAKDSDKSLVPVASEANAGSSSSMDWE
ncbi:hypothetical protein FRC04_006673 [Tulasnella sp. 424]|nr:hypothetical protein FRC04_006673 [Tulasnella sp. 424]